MKSKKIIVVLIIIIILFALGFVIYKIIKTNEIKRELELIAINYFENDFQEYLPTIVKNKGEVKFELSELKEVGVDIAFFENKKCNLKNTYALVYYNSLEDYKITTAIDCE